MSKPVEANERIARKVTQGYKKIEEGVVGGYKKIEDGVYVLAFYTLCVGTVFSIMVLPGRIGRIKRQILGTSLGNRYATDRVFRTKVSLCASLAVNLLYAAVNVLLWYLYRSWWFVCLAVYYGIMSAMRFLLVRYVRNNEIGTDRYGELKRSVVCSYIVLLLNVFLSGAVLMMVYQNKGYAYHGIMIYVMAMYTFYMAAHCPADPPPDRGIDEMIARGCLKKHPLFSFAEKRKLGQTIPYDVR